MNDGVFVTGTDTGCGKTLAAVSLVRGLRAQGLRVAGFKPIAAGAEWRDGKLQNDDALALAAASGLDLPYAQVNPYCFGPAIAPHLAATEAGVRIDPLVVRGACEALAGASDFVVAEGAGGWRVPLDGVVDMQAIALMLGLPVILVVGLRLGCINHARLSEQAILDSGAPLLGWIGSQVDPQMQRLQHNIDTLDDCLAGPCLGVLGHPQSAEPLGREVPLAIRALLDVR